MGARVPVFRLNRQLLFPPPALAEPSGLLAVGGDLSPERMILGYKSGIFPWYSEGEPICWHSPDPRFVLEPASLHVPRSLAKILRRGDYEIRLDSRFDEVVRRCATSIRPGQSGTWITRGMQLAYTRLHEQGVAHSAEAWSDGMLVGGLYGISLGGVFFGESMFADAPDASKCAFVTLVSWLAQRGCQLIDSQVHTKHLARFGGVQWARERYLDRLAELVHAPGVPAPWCLDPPLLPP